MPPRLNPSQETDQRHHPPGCVYSPVLKDGYNWHKEVPSTVAHHRRVYPVKCLLQKLAFTQAASRENIASGETIAVLLGKIEKWLADLRKLAFLDTVSTAQIEDNAVTDDKIVNGSNLLHSDDFIVFQDTID